MMNKRRLSKFVTVITQSLTTTTEIDLSTERGTETQYEAST